MKHVRFPSNISEKIKNISYFLSDISGNRQRLFSVWSVICMILWNDDANLYFFAFCCHYFPKLRFLQLLSILLLCYLRFLLLLHVLLDLLPFVLPATLLTMRCIQKVSFLLVCQESTGTGECLVTIHIIFSLFLWEAFWEVSVRWCHCGKFQKHGWKCCLRCMAWRGQKLDAASILLNFLDCVIKHLLTQIFWRQAKR